MLRRAWCRVGSECERAVGKHAMIDRRRAELAAGAAASLLGGTLDAPEGGSGRAPWSSYYRFLNIAVRFSANALGPSSESSMPRRLNSRALANACASGWLME